MSSKQVNEARDAVERLVERHDKVREGKVDRETTAIRRLFVALDNLPNGPPHEGRVWRDNAGHETTRSLVGAMTELVAAAKECSEISALHIWPPLWQLREGCDEGYKLYELAHAGHADEVIELNEKLMRVPPKVVGGRTIYVWEEVQATIFRWIPDAVRTGLEEWVNPREKTADKEAMDAFIDAALDRDVPTKEIKAEVHRRWGVRIEMGTLRTRKSRRKRKQ